MLDLISYNLVIKI